MTIVFRFSSFYFVVVVAFNAHVLMIDSDQSHTNADKFVSRLFNEDGRYREDLHEQRSQVEFFSTADHVINMRLAYWFDTLSSVVHATTRKIASTIVGKLSGFAASAVGRTVVHATSGHRKERYPMGSGKLGYAIA
jgi:hypothetical protein